MAKTKTTPANLEELTKAWAEAKNRMDDASKDVERLRDEIIEAGGTVGYKDGYLQIARTPTVEGVAFAQVVENARLEKVLRDEGCYEDVLERTPSLKKVRAVATLKPKVAKALEAITKDAPRFLRASV